MENDIDGMVTRLETNAGVAEGPLVDGIDERVVTSDDAVDR